MFAMRWDYIFEFSTKRRRIRLYLFIYFILNNNNGINTKVNNPE